jgi:hypothetical protein
MKRLLWRVTLGMAVVALPSSLFAGAVQITNDVPLNFGSLISGGAAGAMVVSSSGATSTTGGVVAFGAAATPGSFTITIEQGNPNYTILLPSAATLTGTGANMTVDGFESTPGTGGHIRPPAGMQVMTVGATLHVGANQAAGSYIGTFNITVTSP